MKLIDGEFGKWIEVENKPCESKVVLVTVRTRGHTLVCTAYYDETLNTFDIIMTEQAKLMLTGVTLTVIAWMDLPMAYRGMYETTPR
jgi:hypothetical protein